MRNIFKKYKVSSENLAMPEIHTDRAKEGKEVKIDEREINYDNLAMPEIHFGKSHSEEPKSTDEE